MSSTKKKASDKLKKPKRPRQPVYFVDPDSGDVIDLDYSTATFQGTNSNPLRAFCVKQINPKKIFDPRFYRTKDVSKTTRILIGCLKGDYQPRKQTCKTGTKIREKWTLAKNGERCSVGSKRKMKRISFRS